MAKTKDKQTQTNAAPQADLAPAAALQEPSDATVAEGVASAPSDEGAASAADAPPAAQADEPAIVDPAPLPIVDLTPPPPPAPEFRMVAVTRVKLRGRYFEPEAELPSELLTQEIATLLLDAAAIREA